MHQDFAVQMQQYQEEQKRAMDELKYQMSMGRGNADDDEMRRLMELQKT